MAIEFLNLHRANAPHESAIRETMTRVIDSGWYVLGAETEAFECEFARYCGVAHCIGVANGLDALHLILRGSGIGAGDEVIVPSNTCIATWLAVSLAGAAPVPVEPDERTWNIDPARIGAAITPRTRAITPVHLYGQPATATQSSAAPGIRTRRSCCRRSRAAASPSYCRPPNRWSPFATCPPGSRRADPP